MRDHGRDGRSGQWARRGYGADRSAGAGAARTRIGDAERDRAAGLLQQHAAAGRLTLDELGDRLEVVYAARYPEEIDPLFSDLPRIAPPTPATPVRHRARVRVPRLVTSSAGAFLIVLALAYLALGSVGVGPVLVLFPAMVFALLVASAVLVVTRIMALALRAGMTGPMAWWSQAWCSGWDRGAAHHRSGPRHAQRSDEDPWGWRSV